MKTIEVIFTDKYVESVPTSINKYLFLCNSCEVFIGDLITDERYSNKLQVINIYDTSEPVQKGWRLKIVHIDKIEHKTRAIPIDLEQAREWYNSNNELLKKLALTAYSKQELCSYKYIESQVDTTSTVLSLPAEALWVFNTLAIFTVIARYFNAGWTKTESNTGYFIGKSKINVNATATSYKNIYIFRHDNVKYPGIVYFKNKEDVIKALHILGEENLNDLF